jgi:hypothetical protein
MRVLVACEFSGIVREAFRRRGHYAMSCDLEDSELPGPHYKGDVRDLLDDRWDMMIAFPPCTHLCVSGAKHFWYKEKEQLAAIRFFVRLLLCKSIARICVENPIGVMSTEWRKPDQIVQPWMFGHSHSKAICLWLKGLPKLKAERVMLGRREAYTHEALLYFSDKAVLARERSRTYEGLAMAMANQWGGLGVGIDI